MEIIAAIVNHTPDHQLVVEDQMLYVFSPVVASHPFNFLNLCIESFNVQDESLFGAQAALRTSINMMIYPDLYRYGHNGGYGGGHPHSFWERNITFSGRNLTIREILTRIARANGKALWIVRLQPDELKGPRPKWVGVPRNDHGHSPLNGRWHFLELSNKQD